MDSLYSNKRKSGIAPVGEIPWGTSLCQFYRTEQDQLDVLVPYFKAGLENNERCVWVTSGLIGTEDARAALKQAIPGFAKYARTGQIEITHEKQWHGGSGEPLDAIVSRLDDAVCRGLDGIRLAVIVPTGRRGGKVPGIDPASVDLSRHNVISIFAYRRDHFDAASLMDVVKDHRFALVHDADGLEVIESSEARLAKDALTRSEEQLRSIVSYMAEGFAYARIMLDKNSKPCDFVFLEINDAFEKIIGLNAADVVGNRLSQVLPGVDRDPADWIGIYGRVALTGKPAKFESYSDALKRWYSVSAFSPHKGFFGVTFTDITERKRNEEALRASEQRWATTLSSIGDAVIATDTNAKVAFMNAVAEELTGWTQQEAAGRPIAEVFHIINESTRAPVENPVDRVLRDGVVVSLANHTVLVRKDRTEVQIDDSGAPIKNEDGTTAGVVLVFRDVTERRETEEALRASEEKYRTIVTTASEGVWVVDGDRRTTYANDRMASMLGYSVEELTAKPWTELVSAAGRRASDERVKRRKQGAETAPANYEMELTRRDGAPLWAAISSTPLFDETGRYLGSVSMVTDISERKKVEEALRVRDNELSTILANVPVSLLVVDGERRILQVNDAAARFAGRQIEDMLGLRTGNALGCLNSMDDPRGCGFGPACQTCRIRRTILDTFESGARHAQVEWQLPFMRQGSREDLTFSLATVPLSADDSGKKRVLVCLEDITERKKAEQLKDEFIGMVSHELKTPLTVILGSLQVAATHGVTQEEAKELTSDAVSAAGSMAVIVDNLLELSRHQANRLGLQMVRTDIGAIARSVVKKLESRSERHRLIVGFPKRVPAVPADPIRIERILHNLVENAIKYSPKGGDVKISAQRQDGALRICVSDQGPGIPPEDQQRLFQSFERLGMGKTSVPGVGLGLRVCRSLVEAHGGQIWVESPPGGGASFNFTLPLKR